MDQALNTIIYSTIAGVSTFLGILLAFKFRKKIISKNILFVSFAAGILLTAAFINIIPEAIELNPGSLMYVLLAIIFLYTLEQRLTFHTCHDEKCDAHYHKGLIGTLGIGFHSLLDGLIIGVGFQAGHTVGLIATFGVLMHEIPEGISIFSILLHSGYEKKKALLNSAYVALATPLGAILALLFLSNIDSNILGILLALAAGSFIYIGASDLLPETHRKLSNFSVPLVFTGALVIYLANLFL